jgi:hypothetical protein
LRRQWLIGLIFLVILVIAVTVGVVVASWPNCCEL